MKKGYIEKSKVVINNPTQRFKNLFKIKDKNEESNQESNQESLDKYQALTPILNTNSSYYDALKWSVENNEIKNIAISGSYGSGKSSIIKNFISKRQEKISRKDFVEISIATFNTNKKDSNSDIDNVINIEQEIMQQLFYSVSSDSIPKSKFNRITKHRKKSRITLYLINSIPNSIRKKLPNSLISNLNNLITFIDSTLVFTYAFNIFALYFLISSILSLPDLPNFPFIDQSSIETLILFLIISIFSGWRISKMINSAINLGISKFSIAGTTLDLSTPNNEATFNKYIDELIYFFLNTNYKIVIFEDIDRFEDTSVFENLRNLNILLNNNEEIIQKHKKITFIYAVKENLFIENTKTIETPIHTKFFDFIIPVVKVINSSNSEGHMLKISKNLSSNFKFDATFITEISFFLNDLRMINNIFNEVLIFKEALENPTLDDTKLLSIIIYKNLLPNDYMETLENKGRLYNIFTSEFKKRVIDEIPDGEGISSYDSINNQPITDSQHLFSEPIHITLEKHNMITASHSPIYKEINFLNSNDFMKYLILQKWITEDYIDYLSFSYEDVWSISDQKFIKSFLINQFNDSNYFKIKLKKPKQIILKLSEEQLLKKGIYNFDLLYWLFITDRHDAPLAEKQTIKVKKSILTKNFNTNVAEFVSFVLKVIEISNPISEFYVKTYSYQNFFENLFYLIHDDLYLSIFNEFLDIAALDNIPQESWQFKQFLKYYLTYFTDKVDFIELDTEIHKKILDFIDEDSDFYEELDLVL